jgi:hypothetical protein
MPSKGGGFAKVQVPGTERRAANLVAIPAAYGNLTTALPDVKNR